MAGDAAAHPLKCLECKASLVSPMVCDGCETLCTCVQSTDYFELLGLDCHYHLDEQKLACAFRALVRNIHPDRFGGQPAEVRAFAVRMCSELNEAHRVLADPTLRASYMLELVGGPSATQIRGAPGNLLAEVVMIREKIDHARASGDTATLGQLHAMLTTRREDTLAQIAAAVDQLETADDDDRARLRKSLNSVGYCDRLLGELAMDPPLSPPEVTSE